MLMHAKMSYISCHTDSATTKFTTESTIHLGLFRNAHDSVYRMPEIVNRMPTFAYGVPTVVIWMPGYLVKSNIHIVSRGFSNFTTVGGWAIAIETETESHHRGFALQLLVAGVHLMDLVDTKRFVG